MVTEANVAGHSTPIPGAYSELDLSGLDQPTTASRGVVAIVGTALGGKPVSAMVSHKDIPRLNVADDVLTKYRGGDIREGANILFSPGEDADIPGGASQVLALKVNPATKSTGALGTNIDIDSTDWGDHTQQINVSVAAGTTRGKKVSINFEGTTEVLDNLGGQAVATLTYKRGTLGYDAITLGVASNGALTVAADRSATTPASLITTQIVAGSTARVVSTSAADTTQKVTIYGLNNAGTPAPQKETLSLNGTTPVAGTATWSAIYGVEIDSAHAGTVEVRDNVTGTFPVVFDVPTGTLLEGVVACTACYVASVGFTAKLGGAGTPKLIVFGKDGALADLADVVTLAGTTPVASVATTFTQIDRIITGNIISATVTVTANAAVTIPTVQSTVQKLADFFNARSIAVAGPDYVGFKWVTSTGTTSMPPTKFDAISPAVSILNPATPSIMADRWAIIDGVNQQSALVTFKAGVTAAPPAVTTQPVYLRGGVEGTATTTDWIKAFTLLRKARCNIVVPITGDPAIHDLAVKHRRYVAGEGRNEQNVYVGVLNTALTNVPTKDEFLAAIRLLNEPGVRAVGQAMTRFDTNLEKSRMLPPLLACVAAGMQAGAPTGTSLTFKFADVDDIDQHNSWDPDADAKEMLRGGALILRAVDNVGFQWLRNITTHLKDNNLGRIEGSVVDILDESSFRLRAAVERLTAKRGLTKAKVRSTITNELGLQVVDGLLVSYDPDSIKVDFVGDKVPIAVSVAPEVPKNFHLIKIQPRLAA